MWSAARSAKISMILCMPERVSGGDAKFQGFCDGWNKWEGQLELRIFFPMVSFSLLGLQHPEPNGSRRATPTSTFHIDRDISFRPKPISHSISLHLPLPDVRRLHSHLLHGPAVVRFLTQRHTYLHVQEIFPMLPD